MKEFSPLDVVCSFCGAGIGQPCVTGTGKRFKSTRYKQRTHHHSERLELASVGSAVFFRQEQGAGSAGGKAKANAINRSNSAKQRAVSLLNNRSNGYWLTDNEGNRRYVAYKSSEYKNAENKLRTRRMRQWRRFNQ